MPVMAAIEAAFCRSAPWRSFARRRVLPWALDGHQLSGDVLEIGGGSGAMAAGAARSFPGTDFTVTDVDAAMVDSARRRLAEYDNVTVQVASVTSLPFNNASFDVVTSYLMLHHVVDWADALVEVSRVLRPGGVFIGYDMTSTLIARGIHKVDGSPHRMIAPDELADGLAVARFAEITIHPSMGSHLMRFRALKRSETG